MSIRSLRAGRVLAPLLAVASLAACTDQLPVAAREQRLPEPLTALQAFECNASIADGLSCRPAGAGNSGASRAIVGGQNMFVRLSSSNAAYDSVTQIFSVDVTVQNLMNEAMGTPDGVTADPEGIQVFFHGEPVASGGTGQVTVFNETGEGFFTGGGQPYFGYNEILDKDEVSGTMSWQFEMPVTATGFSFVVMIETDVQYLLVLNEVLANPGGTISDANGEWIEVYNAGSRSVDMQSLVIADSAASGRRPYHLISSSLPVAPGAYVVLGNTTNTTNNGGVPVDYAYGAALALANSLDAIKISRVVGTDTLTVDRTQYATPASSVNGASRELTNPALDNSNMDGSNWAEALVTAVYGPGGRGTPKAQNSTFTP